MKKEAKVFAAVLAGAFLLSFSGCKPEAHFHKYAEDEWAGDSFYHWHKCETCDEKIGMFEHTWDKGEITKAATEEEEGETSYICIVCAKTKKEQIDKVVHTHTFSADWSGDATHHWHEADCGHADFISCMAAHNWIDGACSVCGVKKGAETAGTGTAGTAGADSGTASSNASSSGTAGTTGGNSSSSSGGNSSAGSSSSGDSSGGSSSGVDVSVAHSWNSGDVAKAATCTDVGLKVYSCSDCGLAKTEILPAAGHSAETAWTSDGITHWHKCSNCDETLDAASHTWGSEVIPVPTAESGAVKVQSCTGCGREKKEVIARSLEEIGEYKAIYVQSAPVCAGGSPLVRGASFGSWPQTIKADDVDITDISFVHGAHTYYAGSDGEWYVEVEENGYDTNFTYSNGIKVAKLVEAEPNILYFKVEPIEWSFLDDQKGYLLATKILASNIPFYPYREGIRATGDIFSTYPSNYKHSRIHAFLNGTPYIEKKSSSAEQEEVDPFNGKGFLQTAFTEKQRDLILKSAVTDKSTARATEGYVFLPSRDELINNAYNMTTVWQRIRVPTDFAVANYVRQSEETIKEKSNGGNEYVTYKFVSSKWITRDRDDDDKVCSIECNGDYMWYSSYSSSYYNEYSYVTDNSVGIVPALYVSN